MSIKNTTDQSRRHFLKGAAYVSALSVGGLSSVAFATKGSTAIDKSADSISNNGIKIIQETLFDRESVTLINESGKLQMLDVRQPISLQQKNGSLVVKVNQNDADAVNGMVLMSPNQRFTFDVKAIGIDLSKANNLPALTNLAENQLRITSQHSVFNRIVAVELV